MTRAKAKIQSSLRPGLLGRNLQGKPWSSLSESSSSVPNYEPPRCCTHSSTLPGTSQDGPNLTPSHFWARKGKICPQCVTFNPVGTPEGKGTRECFGECLHACGQESGGGLGASDFSSFTYQL